MSEEDISVIKAHVSVQKDVHPELFEYVRERKKNKAAVLVRLASDGVRGIGKVEGSSSPLISENLEREGSVDDKGNWDSIKEEFGAVGL